MILRLFCSFLVVLAILSCHPPAVDKFGNHKTGPRLSRPEVRYFMEIDSGHETFDVSVISSKMMPSKFKITEVYLLNIKMCIRDSYNSGLCTKHYLILFEFAAVIVCQIKNFP